MSCRRPSNRAARLTFAHRLIGGGVDLIHGHSSHHPGPAGVFGGKLVLYGCGDCINDYEAITGHERYRGDLRLLYFASLRPGTGTLAALQMAPLQASNLRLRRAPQADARWLATAMQRASRRFGSRAGLQPDGLLALRSGAS
jgi:poly-gamma-glutamate synthesis protein (capsule biosynthesis protein)